MPTRNTALAISASPSEKPAFPCPTMSLSPVPTSPLPPCETVKLRFAGIYPAASSIPAEISQIRRTRETAD